ncbi:MAG TPA: hypothetical protein VG347_24855 [Verrucomicrobiae bacterium]|nr:hypothetical protein [Verrucomicrobiae bacterium]
MPEPIRDIFPHLEGELCDLYSRLNVFKRLFSEKKERTDFLASQLDPLLAMFQTLLWESIILSVAKLTDVDNLKNAQTNIGLKKLITYGIQNPNRPEFPKIAARSYDEIEVSAKKWQQHRHKNIAHNSLEYMNGTVAPDEISVNDGLLLLEQMGNFLNLFNFEYRNLTAFYEMMPAIDVTSSSETAVAKAHAYDQLVREGKILSNLCREVRNKFFLDAIS